jgi:hypothetical protein
MGYRKSGKLLHEESGPRATIGLSKESITLLTCFFNRSASIVIGAGNLSQLCKLAIAETCIFSDTASLLAHKLPCRSAGLSQHLAECTYVPQNLRYCHHPWTTERSPLVSGSLPARLAHSRIHSFYILRQSGHTLQGHFFVSLQHSE